MSQRTPNHQRDPQQRDERMRNMGGRQRYRGENSRPGDDDWQEQQHRHYQGSEGSQGYPSSQGGDWRERGGPGGRQDWQGQQRGMRGGQRDWQPGRPDWQQGGMQGGGGQDFQGSRRYGQGSYQRNVSNLSEGWPDIESEHENAGYGVLGDEITGGDYLRDTRSTAAYGGGLDYQHGGGRWGGYGSAEYPHSDWSRERGSDWRHQRGSGAHGSGSYGPGSAAYGQGSRSFGPRSGYGENAGQGDNRSSMYGSDYQAQSYRGKGPKNYTRSDERIKEDLCERLMDDDATDASGITINVKDGIVTLDGSVEERWVKHRVEDMAEACSGVKDVVNHLRVSSATGSVGSSSGIGAGSGSSASTGAGSSGAGSGAGGGGSATSSGATSATGAARGKSSNLS